MATASKARQPVKPARTVQLVSRPDPIGLLAITVGTDRTCYLLERVPADFGAAFALTKLALVEVATGVFEQRPEYTYHVHLDRQLGDSCDCKGFIRWRRCKHHGAVAELVRRGLLQPAEPPAPAAPGPDAA